MADEFQKERAQIQKEPALSDALSETRPPLADDNRFQRPDQVRNSRALTALCLGIFSLMLSGGWWIAMNASESNRGESFRLGITTWIGPLQLVLGLITLIFGILGLNWRWPYRVEHPILVGCGIVMGILTVLFWLFICYILLLHLLFPVGINTWH